MYPSVIAGIVHITYQFLFFFFLEFILIPDMLTLHKSNRTASISRRNIENLRKLADSAQKCMLNLTTLGIAALQNKIIQLVSIWTLFGVCKSYT